MSQNTCQPSPNHTNQQLLDAAISIGDHLLETAIWDETAMHCNWLCRRDIQDREIAAYSERTAASGPELYSGTAGIALFLHALFKKTDARKYQEHAIAAWQRSVFYLRHNDFPASAISFYAGDLGLLYVGYRLVDSDSDIAPRLAPDLHWLQANLSEGLSAKHSLDVIGGNAGAIAPLLMIAAKYDAPLCKEIAIQCADEILNLATWNGEVCLWASPKIHGVELDHPPLTGYSHGASGIGVALLEIFDITGNEGYLRHANGAFEFEEQLFNPDEENWIDTRYPHFKRDGKIVGTFRGAWCHGAPGIALAHMRAAELNEGRMVFHHERFQAAIKTTRKILEDRLKIFDRDATLCHGVFGLLDILLSFAFRQKDVEMIEYCRNRALCYLENFESPILLPSGLVSGGYSPALLVGLSGIGMHFLRASSDGEIPSVLMIANGY